MVASQLNPPHGTKRIRKERKTKTNIASEDTVRVKVWRVSPEGGRESMLGRICERGRSEAEYERVRKLMMIVVT